MPHESTPASHSLRAAVLTTDARNGHSLITVFVRRCAHPPLDNCDEKEQEGRQDGPVIHRRSLRARKTIIRPVSDNTNADGSGKNLVFECGGYCRDPQWSPDGSRIAFADGEPPAANIYLINQDGSGLVQLTDSRDGFSRHLDTKPERVHVPSKYSGVHGKGCASLSYSPQVKAAPLTRG